jgi:hypothetical protein
VENLYGCRRVRSGVIIQIYEVLNGWKVDSFANRQVIDIFIHAKQAELEVRGARWLVRFWKLRTSLDLCACSPCTAYISSTCFKNPSRCHKPMLSSRERYKLHLLQRQVIFLLQKLRVTESFHQCRHHAIIFPIANRLSEMWSAPIQWVGGSIVPYTCILGLTPLEPSGWSYFSPLPFCVWHRLERCLVKKHANSMSIS